MSEIKGALVTGGARGIGRAVVETLAKRGFHVVFCGTDPERARAAEAEMKAAGMNVHGLAADVRDPHSVRSLVDFAVERLNRSLCVLVNNAGRSGGGPTLQIDDSLWDDVIATNLTSVFRVTREVLARSAMLERGWGRIINVASTGGKQGVVFGAPYSASKHGVVGFSKSLGLELAQTGVTVNAVCPGYVATDMAEKVRSGLSELWKCTPEQAKQRIEQRIPIGRYVQPHEVAELVAQLTSEAMGSVTAQAINVCGGLGNY